MTPEGRVLYEKSQKPRVVQPADRPAARSWTGRLPGQARRQRRSLGKLLLRRHAGGHDTRPQRSHALLLHRGRRELRGGLHHAPGLLPSYRRQHGQYTHRRAPSVPGSAERLQLYKRQLQRQDPAAYGGFVPEHRRLQRARRTQRRGDAYRLHRRRGAVHGVDPGGRPHEPLWQPRRGHVHQQVP